MIDLMDALPGMMPHSPHTLCDVDLLTWNSFNCLLPAFDCGQYSDCNQFNGKCDCPPGFGGDDCLSPGMNKSYRCTRFMNLILSSLRLFSRWERPTNARWRLLWL